jgi:hypothetical protein
VRSGRGMGQVCAHSCGHRRVEHPSSRDSNAPHLPLAACLAVAALFLAVTLGIYSKIFKAADGYATHGSGYTLAVFSCVWTALSAAYFGVCFLMSKGFGDDGYASF